jgi:hypothetical protein
MASHEPVYPHVLQTVVVLFDARNHFTKLNALFLPYNYYRESDKLCSPLPIGYLAYSSLSQNTKLFT